MPSIKYARRRESGLKIEVIAEPCGFLSPSAAIASLRRFSATYMLRVDANTETARSETWNHYRI